MNIERRLRDVEELETGIAGEPMVLPCRGCRPSGTIAWSNPMPGEHSVFFPQLLLRRFARNLGAPVTHVLFLRFLLFVARDKS